MITVAPDRLFLVGLPRTGSTLLRHALNRISGVAIAPETHFMARSRSLALSRRLEQVRRGGGDLAAVVGDVVDGRFWPWLARNVTAADFERRLRGGDLSERGLFDLLLQLYSSAAPMAADPVRVLGEKTPAHLAEVETFAGWFPEARFIHTIRDPRAVYASRLRRAQQGRWGLKARFPQVPDQLVDPLLPAIEASYAAVSWRRAARLDARYRRLLGRRYMLVRFEDLVSDPEATLRRACDFVGLEFSPTVLIEADIVGSSFEPLRHAGSGFDPLVADRWRSQVSPILAILIAAATAPGFRRLGYRR